MSQISQKKDSSIQKPPCVLVIEDDRAYANVFQRKLSMEGFCVNICNGTGDVLKTVEDTKPELVVLDLVLPAGKSGFDLIKELKNNALTATVKIVIATNLSQESDKEKALGSGAVDYFVKSNISVNEMVTRVKQAIGK